MQLIRNALIYDGSPEKPFKGSVLVGENGLIDEVFRNNPEINAPAIDAEGLCLCPGVIDMHAHSDLEVLRDTKMGAKTGQGITTDLSGNCGVGVFPVNEKIGIPRELLTDILGDYSSIMFKDYNSYLGSFSSDYNILSLQSHSALRFYAMEGNPNREATEDEIKTMEKLLEQSLEQGCLGLSSGLYYAPCIYASKEELVRLCRIVAKHGKTFCVHHRCEGSEILQSLDEVMSIALEADVRLEISHLKVIGLKNGYLVPQVLEKLEKCPVCIGFDQYPYEYGSTSLFSLLPPSVLAFSSEKQHELLKDRDARKRIENEIMNPKGWDSVVYLSGFESIIALSLSLFPQYTGMNFIEIAENRSQSCFDALFDILSEETGTALMIDYTQSREDLMTVFRHPMGVFGTDALYTEGARHPRSYNSVPHVLDRRFLNDAGCTTEFAVNRMTGKTADRLGLRDCGYIRKGRRADLLLFDPNLTDISDIAHPSAPCPGIRKVFLKGKSV